MISVIIDNGWIFQRSDLIWAGGGEWAGASHFPPYIRLAFTEQEADRCFPSAWLCHALYDPHSPTNCWVSWSGWESFKVTGLKSRPTWLHQALSSHFQSQLNQCFYSGRAFGGRVKSRSLEFSLCSSDSVSLGWKHRLYITYKYPNDIWSCLWESIWQILG